MKGEYGTPCRLIDGGIYDARSDSNEWKIGRNSGIWFHNITKIETG